MYAFVFLFFVLLVYSSVYVNWNIQIFQNLQICSLFTMRLTWFHSLTGCLSPSLYLHLLLLKATAGVGELSALWDILSRFQGKEQLPNGKQKWQKRNPKCNSNSYSWRRVVAPKTTRQLPVDSPRRENPWQTVSEVPSQASEEPRPWPWHRNNWEICQSFAWPKSNEIIQTWPNEMISRYQLMQQILMWVR